MNIEELLSGESKNVEYKARRPEKSIRYVKSVVAFANGMGGYIVFGVEDKTREVVGIPRLIKQMSEYGLREPEFSDMEIALRVNFYRAAEVPDTPAEVPDTPAEVLDTPADVSDTSQCTEQQRAIVGYIATHGRVASPEVAALFRVGERRARVVLSEMVEKGRPSSIAGNVL